MLGTGDSPDQTVDLIMGDGRFYSHSVRLGINKYRNRFLFKAGTGYIYEEYLSDKYRNRFEFNIGVAYGF